ncbi:MAG: phytochelatin synthase family protein [Roseiarcus sp.]|uniref:phytochelatin synthase family protein n=1 Tax=Roseiarcus sp. TaxID=1969460 RepID=UPI003BAF9136
MRAAFARTSFVLALLLTAGASAEGLKLPDNLVDLRSSQGEAYLLEAHGLEAYFPISVAFETQRTQSYCGVASMVMVLNAIGAPAPTTPEFQPYTVFTQDNVLNEKTDAIRSRDAILHRGMTVDQLGGILSLYPVTVEVHHAETGGVDEFRKLASETLASKNRFVIVNFQRKTLGEVIGGHISPLAAYDEKSDRFLILDVARYKYPPVWVKTADLFDAMNTPDSDNDNKTRGYVLISSQASAGDALKP